MSQLQLLDWDSRHFGIPVARIPCPDLDDATLRGALAGARREGVRLLYWPAPQGRELPECLLREYGGKLVDRKVVFEKNLTPGGGRPRGPEGLKVVPYPKGPPSETLLGLAVAAGLHSRFRVDGRIPPGKVEDLYEEWMEGSTTGRLADEVLVASFTGDVADAVGVVTLGTKGTAGSIGLMAVSESARGRGVGSSLLQGADAWMNARRLATATVVTQGDNRPACKLYEQGGYQVKCVQFVYHFWPAVCGCAAPLPGVAVGD